MRWSQMAAALTAWACAETEKGTADTGRLACDPAALTLACSEAAASGCADRGVAEQAASCSSEDLTEVAASWGVDFEIFGVGGGLDGGGGETRAEGVEGSCAFACNPPVEEDPPSTSTDTGAPGPSATVGCAGSAYDSLAAAVADGQTWVGLCPGLYVESLRLSDSLRVEGLGRRDEVVWSSGPETTLSGETGVLELINLTLADSARPFDLTVAQRLELRGVEVRSMTGLWAPAGNELPATITTGTDGLAVILTDLVWRENEPDLWFFSREPVWESLTAERVIWLANAGALRTDGIAEIVLEESVFEDNQLMTRSALDVIDASEVRLASVTFSGNQSASSVLANQAAAASLIGTDQLSLREVSFRGNTLTECPIGDLQPGKAAALHVVGFSGVELIETDFLDNTAEHCHVHSLAGAAMVTSTLEVYVTGGTLRGNLVSAAEDFWVADGLVLREVPYLQLTEVDLEHPGVDIDFNGRDLETSGLTSLVCTDPGECL